MIIQQQRLTNTQPGHNKEYSAVIEKVGDGFILYGKSGAIGSTLVRQPKISDPTDWAAVEAAYQKLIKAKQAKGYRPEGGTTPNVTAPAKADSGIYLHLPQEIDESEIWRLIADDRYMAQEKMNGKHQMVDDHPPEDVVGINKKGQVVGLAAPVAEVMRELNEFKWRNLIDGEAIGAAVYAFDMLFHDGEDLRDKPLTVRHEHLRRFLSQARPALQLAPVAVGIEDKQALYERLKAEGKEGMVFKPLAGYYASSEATEADLQYKVKFWKEADVIVAGKNQKRSIRLEIVGITGDRVPLGSVTVPPNVALPKIGQVIQVVYLYANRTGGLQHPKYSGVVRDDKQMEDCLIGQLQYKDEAIAEEE